MRWDRLFDDLEGQLEHELEAEEVDLVAEEERLRLARLSLRDRILAMADLDRADRAPIVLETAAALAVRATAVGRDWVSGELAGESGPRNAVVVPLAAVVGIRPTAEQLVASVAGDGPAAAATLSARLGLSFVLRDLCRRRTAVAVTLRSGDRVVTGTIDRVARDHLDLAEHDLDEPRRGDRRMRIVAFAALDHIRYRG